MQFLMRFRPVSQRYLCNYSIELCQQVGNEISLSGCCKPVTPQQPPFSLRTAAFWPVWECGQCRGNARVSGSSALQKSFQGWGLPFPAVSQENVIGKGTCMTLPSWVLFDQESEPQVCGRQLCWNAGAIHQGRVVIGVGGGAVETNNCWFVCLLEENCRSAESRIKRTTKKVPLRRSYRVLASYRN